MAWLERRGRKCRLSFRYMARYDADLSRRTLEAGKWTIVRGRHSFRHSLISNCAARGVDQRLIDAWVVHDRGGQAAVS